MTTHSHTDALNQLGDALPASPANDGPIGVDSHTLRQVLEGLQPVTAGDIITRGGDVVLVLRGGE